MGFDISFILSDETVCRKCWILFYFYVEKETMLQNKNVLNIACRLFFIQYAIKLVINKVLKRVISYRIASEPLPFSGQIQQMTKKCFSQKIGFDYLCRLFPKELSDWWNVGLKEFLLWKTGFGQNICIGR